MCPHVVEAQALAATDHGSTLCRRHLRRATVAPESAQSPVRAQGRVCPQLADTDRGPRAPSLGSMARQPSLDPSPLGFDTGESTRCYPFESQGPAAAGRANL